MSETPLIEIEEATLAPREDLDRLRGRALMVAVVGLLATGVGYLVSPESFFRTYLVAWLLWLSVAMGLVAIGMLSHLSGGTWGVLMRRVFEASGRTLPAFVLLGLPLAFGLAELYPWARPGVTDSASPYYDSLIAYKAAYLNVPAFLGRSLAYLAIWSILGFLLSRWSHRHDATGDPGYRVSMQRLSAAGLVLYVLTGTFASVDWIMSLEPHWFSSLFGIGFVAGHGLAAFAFCVPMLLFLSRRRPLQGLVQTKIFHDFGKLMLAFTMLWGYLTVSQYLIIWSGNLPEEVPWYLYRSHHGWQTVTVVLVLGHFALPFAVLLSAGIKKKPERLKWVAFWILAMRWLDIYWQVAPSISHGAVAFGIWDLVAPVGLGGLWLWLLLGQLRNRALVPVREPALKEAMAHG